MRRISGIFWVFVLLLGGSIYAQNNIYLKANRLYFQGNYEKAIPYYEKALSRGVHPISTERLADCYREIGDTKKAEAWYKKAIKSGRVNSSTSLYFARMLHANGKYDEAADQYEIYMNETRDYPTVANDFRSCKLALYLKRQPSPYSAIPLKQLNTNANDLMGANFENSIIFASNGKHLALGQPQESRKKKKHYDLLIAQKSGNNGFSTLAKIKGEANTKSDEFGAAFSPTGDSVCFTRTTIVNLGKNRPPIKIHRIYMARVENGSWRKIESVPFNGPSSVSNQHPVPKGH